jgi:hypothetical protein
MGKENGCQYSINNSTLAIHSIAQGLHLVSRPNYEAQSLACDLLFSFMLLTGVNFTLGTQDSSKRATFTIVSGPGYYPGSWTTLPGRQSPLRTIRSLKNPRDLCSAMARCSARYPQNRINETWSRADLEPHHASPSQLRSGICALQLYSPKMGEL